MLEFTVIVRHFQQMLRAKGSSPAGSAGKLQHQKICKVNVQAEQENKKIAASLGIGFTSGWLEQGQHCWVGLSAQASNQECKLRASDHWVHGLVFQGIPGNGAQKITGGSYCGTSILYMRVWLILFKYLLLNSPASLCHWGLKVPFWI